MGELLDSCCAAFLESCRKNGLFREMRVITGPQGRILTVDGKRCLSFASNNVLGLANHPRVVAAAKAALESLGAGSGGSRLISGNMKIHEELEAACARLKSRPAALVFPTGYAANIGVIPSIAGEGDVVFSDADNHASIIDGIRLSHAEHRIYNHLNMYDLERLLKTTPCEGKRLIITDTVFSMEGAVAPLRNIIELAGKYGAMTMIDEAHATGVLGERGTGGEEYFGITGRVDVIVGTLSKALGSLGGFAAGSAGFRDLLINKARSFIYTTALPPATAASAIEAIRILEEFTSPVRKLKSNIRSLRAVLKGLGFNLPQDETQIILVTIGPEEKAAALAEFLFHKGILAPAVRYPTVPKDAAALRIMASAEHTQQDIEMFAAALRTAKEASIIERR